jgi:hypothetical protein
VTSPLDPTTDPAPPGATAVPGALRAAALASLAAGAIHATAAGSHNGESTVVLIFAVTAALQIGWGALALVRSGWGVTLAGLAINVPAVVGWALTRTTGIGFISGLETAESPGFADTLAAVLAGVAVLGALLAVSPRPSWVARPHPALVGVAGLAALSLAVPGMVSAGGHSHESGHGHADDGHGHAAGTHDMAGMDHDMEGMDHGHEVALPAKPYTATLPVDLGGVPGVTAAQQKEAEDLVTVTLKTLPKFADYRTAEAQGWRSIGDGFGPGSFEHFNNWPLIDDGKILDPNLPESLVYQIQADGSKKLVAAMFMMGRNDTLDDVPKLGGKLVQWHIHDNLCFRGEENAWRVGGIADPSQPCPQGTFRFDGNAPMVHVWIEPTECGPFAALEGIAGGQIKEGETRLCDTAHGATGGLAE